MTTLRGHVHRAPWLAIALVVAALLISMFVPAGYMAGVVDGAFVVRPCDSRQAPGPMAGMAMASGDHADHPHHGDDSGAGDRTHDRVQTTCPFALLAALAIPPLDPILLASAIAFVIAAGFHCIAPPALSRQAWSRPPSQGPPAAG